MSSAHVTRQLQQAIEHHEAGRLAEAEALYRAALRDEPDNADALHLLGVLCLDAGRADDARPLVERAVALSPGAAPFHLSLGNVRNALGEPDGAARAWRRALELAPGLVEAHANLATSAAAAGDWPAAERRWRDVARLVPDQPEAHHQLGRALGAQRRFAVAAEAFATCVRVAQREPAYQLDLGHALRADGRVAESEAPFRRAAELAPSSGEARLGLAMALRDLGRAEEAERVAREAVRLLPGSAAAHHALGGAQYDLGRIDEAVASHRAALALDPSNADARTGLLLLLHYRHGNDAPMLFEEHLEWGRRHADPLSADAALNPNDRDPARVLRVGYVSADFRDHPVAYFFEPVLVAHDRSRVNVTLYSNVARPDEITARLRAAAGAWRDVRAASDDELAAQVRADAIDVLVDLSGHIAGNRLLAFARRPAPVQVTYLGYPDTTGMRAIDYRLTDAWHDPPGETDAFHTERLVRLPGGAWCFRPRDAMPDVSTPPADANGFVTFLSPNKVAKVTDAMLEAWRRVLARVPGSRLIALTGGDEVGARRVRAALGGIDDARVELVPRTSTREYFNLYARADVVLDTFPYNGHTTSCDALWMGLPVVTLAGQTHVTRAGLSLLSKLGLERFVADNVDGYVERAVRAANDREELRELRRTMRDRVRARGLTDGTRVAREIEEAYRAMWRTWCAG